MPMSNTHTSYLLNAVSEKLRSISRNSSRNELYPACDRWKLNNQGVNMSTSTSKNSCQQILADVLKKNKLRTNELSRLMATVDYFLTDLNCFSSLKNVVSSIDGWPCPLEYKNEVLEYTYYGFKIEVSILSENINGRETDSCFLVFNFSEFVLAYHVEELGKECIPCYDYIEDTSESDCSKLYSIVSLICKIVRNFCIFVIQKGGKITAKNEYNCTLALKPMFTEGIVKPHLLKKQKTDGGTSQVPPIYTKLLNKYNAAHQKPNEAARLFAVIHDILLDYYPCTSAVEDHEWPGGIINEGTIIPLWYNFSRVKDEYGTEEKLVYTINLSLLSCNRGVGNPNKEFYMCLRFVGQEDAKCIKKIVQELAPTFIASDLRRDKERIDNIYNWMNAIYDNFISKVILGTYTSFIHTNSGSSARSETSSSSDDYP